MRTDLRSEARSLLAAFACTLLSPCAALAAAGATAGQFSVSNSGAANYSIPITVPPGVAGLEPKLAIQFDSKGGNGYLGMRFSLSGLSQISRCPRNLSQDGEGYDPVDFDDNDRLCLDGKKLVSDRNGAVGAEYRTEIESFSKIESVGGVTYDPQSFTVRTKSGLVMTFGGTSDSRVTHIKPGASESTRRAYIWLVSRIEDPARNYIEFQYLKNEATGEVVPKEIRYAGNHAKVAFTYRPRQGIQPIGYFLGVPQQATQLLEKIETFVDTETQYVRKYALGYEVIGSREHLTSVQECGRGDCLAPTTFSWETYQDGLSLAHTQSTGGFFGSTWEVVAGDLDADGRQDVIAIGLASNVLEVRMQRSTGVGFDESRQALSPSPADPNNWTSLTTDINGDGKSDLVLVRHTITHTVENGVPSEPSNQLETYAYLGNGAVSSNIYVRPGFSTGANNVYSVAVPFADTDKLAGGDVDGDGKKDVVLFHASQERGVHVQVLRSVGNGTFSAGAVQAFQTSLSADYERRTGDFNRDGLMDLAIVRASDDVGVQITTYLSKGDGSFSRTDSSIAGATLPGNDQVLVADVNGDGNSDLVLASLHADSHEFGALRVFLSAGDGEFVNASTGDWRLPSSGIGPLVGDFNGDGFGDLAFITYRFSYGGRLYGIALAPFHGRADGSLAPAPATDGTSLNSINADLEYSKFLVADVNGDAQSDWIVDNFDDDSGAPKTYAFHALPGRSGWLGSITNGLGAKIDIAYKPLTGSSIYGNTAPCGGYPIRVVCAPIYVVAEHSVSSGATVLSRFSRSYREFKHDLMGRGSLGPSQITATDVVQQTRTTTNLRQDFPYIGLIRSKTKALTSGPIVSNVDTTEFDAKTLVVGSRRSYFPYAKTVKEQQDEIPDAVNGIQGRVVTTTVTANTYDDYGNLTTRNVKVYSGIENSSTPFTTETINNYQNDPALWRIGQFTRTTVTRTPPDGVQITRTTAYEYNDPQGRGLLSAEIIEPDEPLLTLRTDYERDGFGNISESTISGSGIAERTKREGFDYAAPNYGRFNTKTITAPDFNEPLSSSLKHEVSRVFDVGTGNPTSVEDPNGLVTSYDYDGLGRRTGEFFNNGGVSAETRTERGTCGQGPSPCASGEVIFVRIYDNAGADALVFYDAFEREVRRIAKSPDGRFTEIATEYDERGRVARRTKPRFQNGATYWSSFVHDDLGRVKEEWAPVEKSSSPLRIVRFEYDGLITRQYDALNRRTSREVNAIGNLVKVSDANNGEISYTYDAFDNLLSTRDSAGSETTIKYNVRGFKEEMTEPNMGRWKYTHNVLGELVRQEDARGQVVTMSYDLLGRMKQRTELEGSTSWTYDTVWKGGLTRVSSPDYARAYTYHPYGAVKQETVSIDSAAIPTAVVAINSFSATPSTIEASQATTLSWQTTNALSCSGSGSLPGWSGSKAVNGSQSITISNTGTYEATLTCTDSARTVFKTISVTVTPPAVRIESFTATPSTVTKNQYARLAWSTTGATGCTAAGFPGWSGSKPVNGSQDVVTSTAGDYHPQLTCTDAQGRTAFAATTLRVSPPDITEFSATPSSVTVGGSTLIKWRAINVSSCTASGNLPGWSGAKATSGQQTLAQNTLGRYEAWLRCTDNLNRSASRWISVAVLPPPPVIDSFTASPTSIYAGQSTTLTWATSNTASCQGEGTMPYWGRTEPTNGTKTITLAEPGTYRADLVCRDTENRIVTARVTVVAEPPPVSIDSFTVAPATFEQKQSTTVQWATSNATTCDATGTLPGWSGSKAGDGQKLIQVNSYGSYQATLTCKDAQNRTASRTVNVTVTELLPKISYFTADPTKFIPGRSTKLDWSTEDAVSCTGSGSLPGWAGSKALAGSKTIPVYNMGNYDATLTCVNNSGRQVSATHTFDVHWSYYDASSSTNSTNSSSESLTLSDVFAASNALIEQFGLESELIPGANATPTWTASTAQSCIAGGSLPAWSGSVPTSGSQTLVLPEAGSYEAVLSCEDADGRTAISVLPLTVGDLQIGNAGPQTLTSQASIPVAAIESFAADPAMVDTGYLTTLIWSAVAEACEASGTLPGWTGTKSASGSETIALAQSGTFDAALECRDAAGRTALRTLTVIAHCQYESDAVCNAVAADTELLYPMLQLLDTEALMADILGPVAEVIGLAEPAENCGPGPIPVPCDAFVPLTTANSAEATEPSTLSTSATSTSSTPMTSAGTSANGMLTFTYQYAYDGMGRVDTITYPGGFQVRHGYSAANGAWTSVSDASTGAAYWQAQGWDEWGQISQTHLGNGVDALRARDPASGRLETITAGVGGGTSVQSLGYGWHAVDTLKHRQDGNQGGLQEQFAADQYDALDRLKGASLMPGPNPSFTADYDGNGNIKTKSGVGTYTYQPARPHAVSTAGSASYQYDANGNMLSGGGASGSRSITWGSYNLPTHIKDGSAVVSLVYGAERQRVRQESSSTANGSRNIYYVGERFEEHHTSSGIERKHHIQTPEGLAAIVTSDSAGTRSEYLHKDHLGSVETVTDGQGTVIQCLSYDAFGKRRDCDWQGNPVPSFLTARGYTGHEHLDEVGLIHMNGRVYDSALGRFLSPDPFVPEPGNTQSYNRYSYVHNNPLAFVDPSGFDLEHSGAPSDGFGLIIIGDLGPPLNWGTPDFAAPISFPSFGMGSISSFDWVGPSAGISYTSVIGTADLDTGQTLPDAETARSSGGEFGDLGQQNEVMYGGSVPLDIGLFGIGRIWQAIKLGAALTASESAVTHGAKFVFDTSVGRFRDAATGRFAAARDLPWPGNRGFTTSQPGLLQPGTVVDRFGSASGRYAGQPGASISQRGLPPGSETMQYTRYEVLKSLPAEIGPAAAAPAFAAQGGAMQYLFEHPINYLVKYGFLVPLP